MFDIVSATGRAFKTLEALIALRAAHTTGGCPDGLLEDAEARFRELGTAMGFIVDKIDDDARAAVEVSADPTAHASTSPGPINCQQRLRHQGKAYPRTCERCGLGPCPFFDKQGNSLMRRSAVEGEARAAE